MKWKKWLWILFLILFLYGGFLRFYGLSSQNFWIDESISAIASRSILHHGLPIFSSGKSYNRALLFHYGMAGFMLFGQNEFNARIISVLFGLGTCVLIYFIGKEYNNKTAEIGLVLSLFLEIFIVYSRQARMYQMEMFFFFLTLFLLYKGLKSKKYLPWSIISFVIAFDTHPMAILLLPVYFYVFLKVKKWYLLVLGFFSLYFVHRYWSLLLGFNLFYLLRYLVFFKYYIPFLLVAVIGLIIGFKKKMTWFLVYSVLSILFVNSFQNLFAFRYVYLVFLPLVILSAYAFSKVKWSWVFVGLYILWLSNLVNPYSYSFIIAPERTILHTDPTEPTADFKGLYNELGDFNGTLIVSFTPACAWYLRDPDYWLGFSFSGAPVNWSKTWALYNGTDTYTKAKVILSVDDFDKVKNGSVVVLDDWSASKMKPQMVQEILTCNKIISKSGINAYKCLQ